MTKENQTALRHGPLSGQDLSLLKTRSVVADGNGNLATVSDVVDGWIESDLGAAQARDLTYIGERDPSDPSRILAPADGWTTDPVAPLVGVDVWYVGHVMRRSENAQDVEWPRVAAFKLIDAAPDHVGDDDTSDLKKGSAVRVGRPAQSGEAAEVVEADPKLAEIISDADIRRVHGSANFGRMPPRDVVNDGIRKSAVGYHCGHTQMMILLDHGLVTKPRSGTSDVNLTKKGKRYARALLHDVLFPKATGGKDD